MTKEDFAAWIIAFGAHFPMSVTSWGRTLAHNSGVGGVPSSQHVKWLAVDVVLDEDFYKEALEEACKEAGLTFIDEKTHIHIMVPREPIDEAKPS